jgi:hypothetical protein
VQQGGAGELDRAHRAGRDLGRDAAGAHHAVATNCLPCRAAGRPISLAC